MVDTYISIVVNIEYYQQMVDAISVLSLPFRPKYFTIGSRVYNKDKSRIDDAERYPKFVNKQISYPSGFDLIGEQIQFGIYGGGTRTTLHEWTHIGCSIILRGKKWAPDNFVFLLKALSRVPGFQHGDSCRRDEWRFRHCNFKSLPPISVEQTIGTDMSAFLPGLYWWTVFSEELAVRHGLDVAELASFVGHYEEWERSDGGKLHAFKLFDQPDDWVREKDRLSGFLETHPNFFSLTRIQPLIDAAQTREEFDKVIKPFWAGAKPW